MLSELLLSSIIEGFASPIKCGIENNVDPMPIMTAPAIKLILEGLVSEFQFRLFLEKTRHKQHNFIVHLR
jgi:hypothetical protein